MASDGTMVYGVANIRKNSREVISVNVHEYQGRRYADLRTWYYSCDGVGTKTELKPSPRGIRFDVEILGYVIKSMQEIYRREIVSSQNRVAESA